MARATKLTKLRMEELSGVDAGANSTPGWIVEKSRQIQEDVEAFEKTITGLFEGLVSEDADLYFSDAPDEVVKARKDVLEFIAKDIEEVEKSDEKESPLDRVRKLFKSSPVPKDEDGEPEKGTFPESNDNKDDRAGVRGKDEDGEPEKGSVPEEGKTEEEATEDREAEAEKPAEEKEEPEGEEEEEKTEKADDREERLVKSLAAVMEDQLNPIREAVGALADRVGDVEKGTAQRLGLDGQEMDGEVEKSGEPETGIAKSLRAAMRTGNPVTIN